MPRLTKKRKAEIEKLEVGMPQGEPPTVKDWYDAVGQDEIMKVLEISEAPEAKQLLQGMLAPREWNFMTLCRNSGMSFTHLVELFGKYKLHEAQIRMASHLPQVIEDTAIDAKSRKEPCPRCDGRGEIPDEEVKEQGDKVEVRLTRVCPLCRGRCEVRVPGDKLARELVFESAGLTGKKGPSVAIQQNFGSDHSIESSVGMTQKLLVP